MRTNGLTMLRGLVVASTLAVASLASALPIELRDENGTRYNFSKTGADAVQWKGKITIADGISLTGLPVTVDIGGVATSFVLKQERQGERRRREQVQPEERRDQGRVGHLLLQPEGRLPDGAGGLRAGRRGGAEVAVSVPVTLAAGPGQCGVDQPFTYNAKVGKSGTAKTS